jgi:hypothetical protein
MNITQIATAMSQQADGINTHVRKLEKLKIGLNTDVDLFETHLHSLLADVARVRIELNRTISDGIDELRSMTGTNTPQSASVVLMKAAE